MPQNPHFFVLNWKCRIRDLFVVPDDFTFSFCNYYQQYWFAHHTKPHLTPKFLSYFTVHSSFQTITDTDSIKRYFLHHTPPPRKHLRQRILENLDIIVHKRLFLLELGLFGYADEGEIAGRKISTSIQTKCWMSGGEGTDVFISLKYRLYPRTLLTKLSALCLAISLSLSVFPSSSLSRSHP